MVPYVAPSRFAELPFLESAEIGIPQALHPPIVKSPHFYYSFLHISPSSISLVTQLYVSSFIQTLFTYHLSCHTGSPPCSFLRCSPHYHSSCMLRTWQRAYVQLCPISEYNSVPRVQEQSFPYKVRWLTRVCKPHRRLVINYHQATCGR